VPEEECLIGLEVARSGSLVVLQSTMKYQGILMGLSAQGGVLNCVWGCQVREPGCFTKYREVPGGYDGTVCLRRNAYLWVEVARSGSLVVLQSTMDYQWVLMGEFA